MIPAAIQELIARGALFFVNHSGGKDSQAMFDFVCEHVPPAQIHVIHADLPDVEWEGVQAHIRATIGAAPLSVCRNENKTLLQMIERRGMFPSPEQRQCTSDLKRGPIERTIRHLVKARRASGIPGAEIVVNCMGMRAEESPGRSKLTTFKLNKGNSVAGREWYDWLPIHDWLVGDVFARIAAAGQQPHWAYAAGMSRLSCCFCIMASKADLTTAARLNPTLYRRYVELERSTGQVMLMPSKKHGRMTLEQVTGIPVAAVV